MTAKFERVEQVFDALTNCSAEERSAKGLKLCGNDESLWQEVESLLNAADSASGFLSYAPRTAADSDLPEFNHDDFVGQQFGTYRIVSEVDRGGMGVVFRAERADGHYESQVAIKIASHSLLSDSLLQRFNAERQFLANLRHPNIAQLLDGGTSECGHPYLVMELIQGAAIDEYCAEQKLDLSDTLRLVESVCDAVHYAHQNLIVHCDLKPANILVPDNGVPKLLDFGIATLMKPELLTHSDESDLTFAAKHSPGKMPFTPEFAAPEQLQGKPVATTADVYSLGILLFKLLTGKLPYAVEDTPLQDIAFTVARTNIPLPSEVAPKSQRNALRGDLDSIVMKALQKDPEQRYSSVQMLSEDLARYRCGEPVHARKHTYRYRTGKFLKRHKWGVAFASLAVVSLVLGSIVSTWQWRVAREQQLQAQSRLQKVHELTSLIVFELPGSIADLPQSTILSERLIRKGVGYLDELAASNTDNPKLQRELATAYFQLARLQGNPMSTNLGDPSLARNNFQKAIDIQEGLLGSHDSAEIDQGKLKVSLATSYMNLGGVEAVSFANLARADTLTEKCVSLLEPMVNNDSPHGMLKRVAGCYSLASHWHNMVGSYPEAKAPLRKLEKLYKLLGQQHPFVRSADGQRLKARMHEEWAEIESQSGNKQSALIHERLRLEITLAHLSDSKLANRHIGYAYQALAARLVGVNELLAAEEAYLNARKHWQDWQETFPSDVSGTQALVLINAELAEVYGKIADLVPLPEASTHAENKVCSRYAESLSHLAQLPEGQTEFPRRYTWSPSPSQIIAGQNRYCQLLQNNS